MRKTTGFLSAAMMSLLLCSAFTSCQKGEMETGTMKLSLASQNGFGTRAVNEDNYKDVSKYVVTVANSEGTTVAGPYGGTNPAAPNTLELPYGNYTVTAKLGNEHAASRDEFLSMDEKQIYIGSGETKSVNLVCAPTCGKCVVNFSEDMATYYEDYSVEYSGTTALGTSNVVWAKEDVEPWYLAVGEEGETVKATIRLTVKEQYVTTGNPTGTVEKSYLLQRNKSWTMNIKPNYTQLKGDLGITITIDEQTNDHEEEIIIPSEWIK